jgi:hypothetical protein
VRPRIIRSGALALTSEPRVGSDERTVQLGGDLAKPVDDERAIVELALGKMTAYGAPRDG